MNLTSVGENSQKSWNELQSAALWYSTGWPVKAQNKLNKVDSKSKLTQAGNFLSGVYYSCLGKLHEGEKYLNKSGVYEESGSRYLLKIFSGDKLFKKALSGRNNFKKTLNSLQPGYCHYRGRLLLAERLYQKLTSKQDKKNIDKWVVSRIKKTKNLNYKDYKSIVAFRLLSFQKLQNQVSQVPWTVDQQDVYEKLRKKHGFTSPFPEVNPWRISALLPLTGKYRLLGIQVMYGLLAAKSLNPGLEIVIHDTKSSPAHTTKLLIEKIQGKDHPIALVAPPDKNSLQAVMNESLPMPVLSVSWYRGLNRSDNLNIFFNQPAKKQKAVALVKSAFNRGARKFVILHPDNSYGKVYSHAFAKTVKKLGGEVLKTMSYSRRKLPRKLYLPKMDAVFIPDTAKNIETLSRVLAASGHFPGYLKKNSPILLSTAEALDSSILRNSGRYLKGAIFAPGIYPDLKSGANQPFLQIMNKWKSSIVLVHALEAYNFYNTVHQIVKDGATSHSDINIGIYKLNAGPGLGTFYDKNGKTYRPPRLYQFDGNKIKRLLH
ncbi:MAG: penicillin-binding protein activator [Deltaproteobacteria bacterium]|nr:penicillin-binding protein activator [Deltaproteobacteria bacterium]